MIVSAKFLLCLYFGGGIIIGLAALVVGVMIFKELFNIIETPFNYDK